MLKGSLQIGKIMGIPVRLHFSWFIIFGLITWALATQYFPQVAPELPRTTNWLRGALAALLLFASVTIHELSHSIVAMRYRIPISSITLFIFGGVAQMREEPSSPKIELQMALAGPFSSYGLALIFFLFFTSLGDQGLKAIAYYLFQLNLILGTFNLIPGFPMDGGRVLRAVLWRKSGNFLSATKSASKTGQGIAVFFIASGFLLLFAGYMQSIWFLLIGWFLYTAAQSSYQQAAVKSILTGVKVRDIMAEEVIGVRADSSLSEIVHDYFLRYGYGGFPVLDGGRLSGIISLREIREVPKEKWAVTQARDVMQVFDDSLAASVNDDMSETFDRMVKEDKERLVVLKADAVVGLITRSGIARYLKMIKELG